MSGIKDVAALAKVSISTVSNVLNNTKYVSPELVARVEDAVKKLNYEVDPIASSMKTKKSGTIGVITEDMCGVFYPYIVKGIDSIATQKGYRLIICDVSTSKQKLAPGETEKELFHKLFASRVDGIIFTSSLSAKEYDNSFLELKNMADNMYRRTPLVSLERDLTMLGIDSVYFDGYVNSQTAVTHLIECGCKKICHIAGPSTLQIVRERVDGYRKCLIKHNLTYTPDMISYGDYTHQSGYLAAMELLETHEHIDAIFCSNDQMAVGALKYLQEHHYSIPDDIMLMGYDDVFISSIVNPPLSTIHIRKKTAGIKAAEILFDRIENPDANDFAIGVKLESRLVVRKSTVKTANEDWDLLDW